MCDVRLCVYVGYQLGDDQLFELFGSIVYVCMLCVRAEQQG
jgi:hypothetical protein